MLIDWITAWVDLDVFSPEDQVTLRSYGDRIQRYNASTGEISWVISAWDSVRSDSHQTTVRVSGEKLWIQGSPARVLDDGDSAFGTGSSSSLHLLGCVERMAEVACQILGVSRPANSELWNLTRCDVTQMILLPSLADVRAALSVLRNCEGGRYRVSQQSGDTVYWSVRSRLKSGKAYAKGPHLRWAQSRKGYNGRIYTSYELSALDRCLRLELRLGAQFWRERTSESWYKIEPCSLRKLHTDYFGRMIGSIEVTDMNIDERVYCIAQTPGAAKSALATWGLIKAFGWEKAKDMHSMRTWYRNLKILRQAGLADSDLSSGNIVFFRRSLVQYREVNTWHELLDSVYQRAA